VQRWYITFHGGETAHAWNNIHTFDLDGRPLGTALDTHSLPHHIRLRELRGFAFGPDRELYVANAYRNASQVLRFSGTVGANGKHAFRDVFVEQHQANPGLSHPFDVTFGPDGHLFVPSQDTNIVGRYYGPRAADGPPGTPMPHPSALSEGDTRRLLPGTFVPSEKHTPRGLRAVRRAIFGADGVLYVADRDTNSVKVYDGTSGAYLREYRHHHLTTPVHLLQAGNGEILVGSRDANTVFAIDTGGDTVRPLLDSGGGGLRSPAGLAFGPDGMLYVCSRETRQILRFDAMSGQPAREPFLDGLADFPEFIALVTHQAG
jgi:DNA-binding beta-propeller fold protein YncE